MPEPIAQLAALGTQPRTPSPAAIDGVVRFLGREERGAFGVGAEQGLVVRIERIQPNARGRLAEVIDDAIERELAARGATSPGIGSATDADASLSDQLFRARQIGVQRLCIALGRLRAAASAGGLAVEDAATLLFWARATRDRPVGLVLDTEDAALGAYVSPTPLAEALSPRAPEPAPDPAPAPLPAAAPEPSSAPSSPAASPSPSASRRQIVGAAVAADEDLWRGWTLALTAARGPQPLAALERLFTQSYLPLCNAISAGLDDPRARHAHDEFSHNFARIYTEACPTFAVTGKRPRMVLDAPDLAARLSRLQGARATQLLFVSAMRSDLGAMVRTGLARALGPRASLADEALLWSALPTTTSRQLEALARGPEALREPPASERELEMVRGRTVETIRRMRIGSRDLFKLDLAEARIRSSSKHVLELLPGIAESLTEVIARHASSFTTRTLLYVFGDHGFSIGTDGVARWGGASPEQVLVPAFAFLVGEVH